MKSLDPASWGQLHLYRPQRLDALLDRGEHSRMNRLGLFRLWT